MRIIFIDGPYGCGKTTLLNRIRELASSSGREDIHFVEEGYLDFLSEHDINSEEFQMEYVLRHTADTLKFGSGIVFVDSSIMLTSVYHECITFTLVETIISAMKSLSDTIVELWLIDIPYNKHWEQVHDRIKILNTEDPESAAQRLGLNELSGLHFRTIRSLLYAPRSRRLFYDLTADPDSLFVHASQIIGIV